jgi:outer membrane lipoprotein-sorting protein
MKRFALILMFAVLCQMAGAQSSAVALRKKLEGKRATFEYSMTIMEKVPVKHTGTVLLDGNFYLITDNGLEYRCDGKTRWTIDESAKEVYIEDSPGAKAFLAAPTEYLDKIKDLIVGESSASGVYSDPEQGVKVNFVLTSIKTSAPTGSSSGFTLDTSKLGKEWVVTDLR